MPRLQRAALSNGRKIWCLHRDEVRGVRAQAAGYWQHGIEISDGAIVFDVGANIGLFSIEAASRGAVVYAFEPMPATFAALTANARECENWRITPHRLALGAKSETAQFAYFPYLSALSTRFPDAPRSRSAAAISAIFDDAEMTPRAGWFRRAPPPLRQVFIAFWQKILFTPRLVKCKVESLSRQIEKFGITRIDLLKIDVEGAEWEVLMGIDAEDWPKIKQIVAEVHDENGRLEQFTRHLRARGFSDLHTEEEPGAGQWGVYLLWARRK